MKTTMYLFVMAILVIAGCAKDKTLFENPENPELKKDIGPPMLYPIKADCWAVPDSKADLIPVNIPGQAVIYFYSRLFVSGTATLLGKIDAEKSYYLIKNTEPLIDEGVPYVQNSGNGIVVGENGDGFEFTWWIKQSLVDGNFLGAMEITPEKGTGIFKGCSGFCDIYGRNAIEGIWFKLDGYMVYEEDCACYEEDCAW